MKIEILQPSGYCAGVSRAMEMALNTKKNNPQGNVVILGMLVHNQDALKELEENGIHTIYDNAKTLLELIDEISNDSIVILTAHGHDKKVEEKLKNKGLTFIDATCPFVMQELEEIKKAINLNHDVIYIGKKNHPEANAALSISNRVHLLELNQFPSLLEIRDRNPFVISQTTFSKLDIDKQIEHIKRIFEKASFQNGVCNASDLRQKALLSLSNDIDLIYVVGGKNSNNTKTLFKIAQDKYLSAKVIMIENADEINKKDLKGLNYIAISSGASTPSRVIEEIKLKIEQLSSD